MLRSLFAVLNQRFGRPRDPIARREFLKASLAVGAAMLPSSGAGSSLKSNGSGRRIIVVGAGFAGLACAYELRHLGYDVTVVEARRRIGGRVRSFNAALGGEFVPGKTVEGGGELIGANHPIWIAYADRFGLSFLDLTDDEIETPILLEGRRLTAEEGARLWEEMDVTLARLNQDAALIDADAPWTAHRAEWLDQHSLHDWIEEQTDVSPLCRQAIAAQETANNGVDTRRQSYLGILAMVKGGGLEKYWTESEVYRCAGGNQQLAVRLAEQIGDERLLLGLPVFSIEQRGDKVLVTCSDGRVLVGGDVVYTAPPSTWGKVRFDPPIPRWLNPQMGVNLKFLAHVKSRFWKERKLAQYSLSDGPISMTWEGTDNQPGNDEASLHCFSGGPVAEACQMIPPAQRNSRYARMLGSLYEGFENHFIKSRFMNWPSDRWTLAGYSFPAPGEVTRCGPQLAEGLGNVHFAGEHACYKFVGYMEGAISSGVHVAEKIARRDGVLRI